VPAADGLILREVRSSDDPAIASFGRLQRSVYFAPETLIPSEFIARGLADQGGARRNFLLIIETAGEVVAGTFFHWLADAQTGFSSFLGIAQAFRGRGLARRLHEARFSKLDQAAGGRAQGVFIDVVNPERLPPEDLERERRVGSDPWQRRRAFGALGFRQVDIRYEQPVGGPNGGPVTNLDLLYCPREPLAMIPTALVVATMRAYWSPWLGEAAQRYAAELGDRAHGRTQLKLLPP
jgi:hypothetical protein